MTLHDHIGLTNHCTPEKCYDTAAANRKACGFKVQDGGDTGYLVQLEIIQPTIHNQSKACTNEE